MRTGKAKQSQEEFEVAVRAFEQASADYERHLAEYEAKRTELATQGREHAEKERPDAFGTGIHELLGGGRACAHLVDERAAGAADDQHAAGRDRQALGLGFRVGDENVSSRRRVREARQQHNAADKP